MARKSKHVRALGINTRNGTFSPYSMRTTSILWVREHVQTVGQRAYRCLFGRFIHHDPSKYMPHQGAQECARRRARV